MEINWSSLFVYNKLFNNLDYYIKNLNVKTRPNASCGLWQFFILPLSIIFSALKLNAVSIQYRNTAIFCISLLISAVIFLLPTKLIKNQLFNYRIFLTVSTVVLVSFLNNVGITLTFFSIILSVSFFIIFPMLLRYFPLCFTAGEAALITESIIVFIFTSVNNFVQIYTKNRLNDMEISTAIIQIGLLGILSLCLITSFRVLQGCYQFYIVTCLVILLFILTPMYLLLNINPLMWLLLFLFKTKQRIGMLAYWILCVIIATITIVKEVERKTKANTSKRKIFHILTVVVFFPALLYECTLIYLSSGVVLGIFITLELIRILNIPPLGSSLQNGFLIFVDEKDSAGGVALSPIYLLVGISLPLWLHPYGCDLTDSAGFHLLPLISGLLTIGIGDTAASAIGMRFGKHQWEGTKKTKEGTAGAILVQLCCLFTLYYLHLISDRDIPKGIIAVVVISLIEAKTDQVDNLILPLLAYIILI